MQGGVLGLENVRARYGTRTDNEKCRFERVGIEVVEQVCEELRKPNIARAEIQSALEESLRTGGVRRRPVVVGETPGHLSSWASRSEHASGTGLGEYSGGSKNAPCLDK